MIIHTDSSLKEACFVIKEEGRPLYPTIVPYEEAVTVNVGEYKAVVLALEKLERLEEKGVAVYTDSLLVANQVNGSWKCRKPYLLPFRDKVRKLLKETETTLEWISRDENWAGWTLEKF